MADDGKILTLLLIVSLIYAIILPFLIREALKEAREDGAGNDADDC